MQAEFDKLPPSDVGAEQCYLGSLMLLGDNEEQFAAARRLVWRDAFYQVDHQLILDAIDAVHSAKGAIDAVLLHAELERCGLLHDISGIAYIAQLLSTIPSAAHAAHYAKIITDRAVERDGIRTATA